MGLFRKKKNAIEQSKKDMLHEIVCLYCFRNFTHDKVMFRALESLDAEGYRAQNDRRLDQYRERFYMEPLGALPVVLDPDEFSEINKGYHRGVLSSLKDEYDNVTTKRICPYCHNDLPKSAGFAPSTIISFVGAPQAGKSVYMTSLIHTLKTVTPRHFSIFCTPISAELSKKFKYEYEDPLIENGHLLASTRNEKQQEPFVFTFSFADGNKPEINIAFWDVADEDVIDNEYMDMYAAHIRNASGLIFLVDPLQFRSMGRKIMSKNHMDDDRGHVEYPVDVVDVLNRLAEDYSCHQSNGASQIPMAVVLTKTDLLEAFKDDDGYIRSNSSLFTDFTHKGTFNLNAFRDINDEVDEFINLADPNFRNALKRRFDRLGFFAVSALGAQPDVIRQRMASYAPLRVDEPFLWLLYKLGYIEGCET